jgi:hypothetical protein
MTTLGSSYATAKAAILAQLKARTGLSDVEVSGEPPVDALKVTGPFGNGQAIWLADAEGEYDNEVFCGAGRLDLDENYRLTVVIQALPVAGDSQADTDLRVDYMLGEVLAEMAADPTWGLTEFQQFETTRAAFRRFVGPIGERNLRPARCELDLEVNARISFT